MSLVHPDVAPPRAALLRRFARVAGAVGICVLGLSMGVFDAGPAAAGLVLMVYLGACLLAAFGLSKEYPHGDLGLCNGVTVLRLGLTACLVTPLFAPESMAWAVFGLAALALCLDGLDGWLARHEGLVSGFGARFDMEVDAALGLVLALNALLVTGIGPLVLLLGLPRYVFVLLGWVAPWLSRPLPERFGRKLVCVVQIVTLLLLQLPGLPPWFGTVAVLGAATALCWSFGRDVAWLWRARP